MITTFDPGGRTTQWSVSNRRPAPACFGPHACLRMYTKRIATLANRPEPTYYQKNIRLSSVPTFIFRVGGSCLVLRRNAVGPCDVFTRAQILTPRKTFFFPHSRAGPSVPSLERVAPESQTENFDRFQNQAGFIAKRIKPTVERIGDFCACVFHKIVAIFLTKLHQHPSMSNFYIFRSRFFVSRKGQ